MAAGSQAASIFARKFTHTALMKISTRFPIRLSLRSQIPHLTTRIAWSSTPLSSSHPSLRFLWTRQSFMSFTSKVLRRICRRFPPTFAAPTQDSPTLPQCAISRSLASLPSSYSQSMQSLMSLSSLNVDSQTTGDTRLCHSLAPNLPMPALLPVRAELRQSLMNFVEWFRSCMKQVSKSSWMSSTTTPVKTVIRVRPCLSADLIRPCTTAGPRDTPRTSSIRQGLETPSIRIIPRLFRSSWTLCAIGYRIWGSMGSASTLPLPWGALLMVSLRCTPF